MADAHKHQIIENTHIGASLCQEFLHCSFFLIDPAEYDLSIIFHSWEAFVDHSIMSQQTYGHRLKLST